MAQPARHRERAGKLYPLAIQSSASLQASFGINYEPTKTMEAGPRFCGAALVEDALRTIGIRLARSAGVRGGSRLKEVSGRNRDLGEHSAIRSRDGSR